MADNKRPAIVPDDIWTRMSVPKDWTAPFREFVIIADLGDIYVPPDVARKVAYTEGGTVDRAASTEAEAWIQARVDEIVNGPHTGPEMPEETKRQFYPWLYEEPHLSGLSPSPSFYLESSDGQRHDCITRIDDRKGGWAHAEICAAQRLAVELGQSVTVRWRDSGNAIGGAFINN